MIRGDVSKRAGAIRRSTSRSIATGRTRQRGDRERAKSMRYMLLITSDPDERNKLTADEASAVTEEYFAFSSRIAASGELIAGDPLHGIDTATTVRIRDGVKSVTDGPFAETKEYFGG